MVFVLNTVVASSITTLDNISEVRAIDDSKEEIRKIGEIVWSFKI